MEKKNIYHSKKNTYLEILQSVHIQEENDVLDIHLLYLAVSLICTRTCLMSVSFVSSLFPILLL